VSTTGDAWGREVAAKRAKYREKKEVKLKKEIFSNWPSKCVEA
jgi:hypothetical protein